MVATFAYFAALAALLALRFESPVAAWASLDFNAALFEDLLGPYWRTGQAIIDGAAAPDPQYVYPAFLGIVLAPLADFGGVAASLLGVHFGALSIYGLAFAAFASAPPRSLKGAAAAGVVAASSYPLAHGVYWANAGLWSLALAAGGWALEVRGRPITGGALIGAACALKLGPLVLLFGLVVGREARAFVAALGTFLVLAAVLPLVVLGPHGAWSFHVAAFENLRALAENAATAEGGRGSSSLVSLAARSVPSLAPWLGYVLSAGALLALLMAAESRTEKGRHGFVPLVLLLAIPTLVVTPGWVHGASWLPVAWWLACTSFLAGRRASPGRAIATGLLATTSFALASLPATWIAGGPATYQASGALTASVVLAVVAVVSSPRATHGETE